MSAEEDNFLPRRQSDGQMKGAYVGFPRASSSSFAVVGLSAGEAARREREESGGGLALASISLL